MSKTYIALEAFRTDSGINFVIRADDRKEAYDKLLQRLKIGSPSHTMEKVKAVYMLINAEEIA